MPVYRLNIRRNQKHLGHFESDAPWALEAVQDIAQRLPAAEGYCIEMQVSDGERRYLEVGPSGIRVLGTERSFRPVTQRSALLSPVE
ncbi:cytoplasmic protein [Stutzerimonas chloritidismutans]|uniref:cytoplasmic protein n=1 Tax=Stutzerimonas chloritidismutans TaxID=203192 RepID=UPI0008B5D8D0|nr:cytoplasmic protein [Stutzerimonas chloritidismutans]OHC14282.1 MAG: cytoplasmic protein [Pseudomonadales bacterium GWC2_63_15]